MTITAKLFAILKDRAGLSQTTLELPTGGTVFDAAELLADRYPNLKTFLPRIAYAVNEQYVGPDTELQNGDELALIPPVSGGCDHDWLELLDTKLDIARAVDFVSSPKAGGIDIFLGTTRDEDQKLLALDYESYETMARKQLRALAEAAHGKWPIISLVILHRLGRVPVGEASVLIAVSTPHRAEAFEACRWIIDQLKKDVTIWKKEIWVNGKPTWVNPTKP
jgi:molybdopterin converting factor subunit 1